MTRSTQLTLRIAEAGPKGPASRAHKQFNSLIKKLEAARAQLAAWNEIMPGIRRQVEQELDPLAQAYAEQQCALVLALDQMAGHKALGEKEGAKLSDWICANAVELLGDTELLAEGDQEQLKEIYNRHSGGDFDAETEQEEQAMRDMVEDMFGVRLDAGVDVLSPEALIDALGAQLHAEQALHAERARDAEQAESAKRRPSAAARAREERQAAEADQLKQSVREIFRKLTSQLHPDREPDAAERDRKTALMQRVNVAYAANDLLALLELQLEVEQIDQTALDNLGETRIKHYNRILEEQLGELARENAALAEMMDFEMGGRPVRGRWTPQALARCVRDDIAAMRDKLDLITLQREHIGNIGMLKALLKQYRPAPVPAPSFGREDWC